MLGLREPKKRQTMNLRERKKRQTREALGEAALTLYATQGFENTTVDQIAAAADVSRRTFFRYFPTKEAALFPSRERRLALFQQQLAQGQDQESPLESVRAALLALAQDYMQSREEFLLQQRIVEASPALLVYDAELDRRWEEAIERALVREEDNEQSQKQNRLIAGALMGLIRVILREWYAAEGKTDLAALGEQAFVLLRDGVGSLIG